MLSKRAAQARETPKPRATLTPLAAVADGLIAAAAGTAAMDLLWFYRYQRGGGEGGFLGWELSSGLCSWDQAPAPAQIGKRLVEGIFQRDIPADQVALVNNVTHWAYGMLGGAQYGIVAGSLATPRIRYGIPFGAGVWLAGYVVLPLAHLYRPIWEYDLETLAKDLSAHLAYGLTTSAAFDLLARA